jgi:hypothetical protein
VINLEEYAKIALDMVAAAQASPRSALRVTMYQKEDLRKAPKRGIVSFLKRNMRYGEQ